jgi:phage-related protein
MKNRDNRDETFEISCRIYIMMYDYKTNEEIRKELNIHNPKDIIVYTDPNGHRTY